MLQAEVAPYSLLQAGKAQAGISSICTSQRKPHQCRASWQLLASLWNVFNLKEKKRERGGSRGSRNEERFQAQDLCRARSVGRGELITKGYGGLCADDDNWASLGNSQDITGNGGWTWSNQTHLCGWIQNWCSLVSSACAFLFPVSFSRQRWVWGCSGLGGCVCAIRFFQYFPTADLGRSKDYH